jgi:Flp pilus assembly protein TadG
LVVVFAVATAAMVVRDYRRCRALWVDSRGLVGGVDRPPVRRGSEVGAGALDLLFAVTILMVFLGLVVSMGQIFYSHGEITDAARDGAQAAVVAATPADAQSQASDVVRSTLRPVKCKTLDVAVDTSNFAPGGSVTVTVSCTINPVDARLAGLAPSITLSSSVSAPMETFRNG